MNSSALNDAALGIYQVVGLPLLRVTLLPTFFVLVALTFAVHYVGPGLFSTSHPNDWMAQVGEASGAILAMIFVGVPMVGIGLYSAIAASTSLVSSYMIGAVPNESEAVRTSTRLLPKLVLLAFYDFLANFSGFLIAFLFLIISAALSRLGDAFGDLSGVIFGFGWFAVVAGLVIGIYVADIRSLAPAILVIEGLGPVEAAKRSRLLIQTKVMGLRSTGFVGLWMMAGLILLFGVGGLAAIERLAHVWVMAALQRLPFSELWITAYQMIPVFLVLWFLVPFIATTLTLRYYDCRVRVEGYDIEALAAEVWRADKQALFEF